MHKSAFIRCSDDALERKEPRTRQKRAFGEIQEPFGQQGGKLMIFLRMLKSLNIAKKHQGMIALSQKSTLKHWLLVVQK